MWVWFVAVLSLVVIWVVGAFLETAFWVKVLLSVGVVVAVASVFAYRRFRAYQAARALEREILRQAEQQAQNARPDRRAEILQLREQVQQGIDALKGSKLGSRYGNDALNALPWYVIVGPPGAGKTTALKHSGLVFPYLDPRGAGTRGVGGTRNCDWWFTNEGILLDTAGRYTTEQDDHEEWVAFLDMLRKYRPKAPINGVLVAVSLSDLADATEEQVEGYAKKIRARIDEIMTRLRMVIPVYVLFTKADLIGGFSEFWGDLRKSERAQIWGATFPLDAGASAEPAAAFEREFALLVETVHARALQRVGAERRIENRQKVFQFPLEFATLRGNLAEFVGELFQSNAFQETPIFRGVYFTSGTQEGRPFDRVVAGMARAFGLRLPSLDEEQMPREPKSYFLADVFKRVVFPDQHVAGQTQSESRRLARARTAAFGVGGLIAFALVGALSCSFIQNRELVSTTGDISSAASQVRWGEGAQLATKAARLEALRARLEQLSTWEQENPPLSMRWGLYAGSGLYPPLRGLYLSLLHAGFEVPTKQELESRLRAIESSARPAPQSFIKQYDDLKLAVMLSQVEHLDVDWAAPRLTRAWAQSMRSSDESDDVVLTPHVKFYLDLMKRGEVPPWAFNAQLIGHARSVLLQVPQMDREYEVLVREANQEIPPIKRETIFYGSSAAFVTSKRNLHVDGAYTKAGWGKVRSLLGAEQSKLRAERWVLGEADTRAQAEIDKQIANLRATYFERFKNAWRDFLSDMQVSEPNNAAHALDELNALSEPEWPYLRLVRTLSENVELELSSAETGEDASILAKAADAAKRKWLGGDAGAPGSQRPMSPVERAFAPLVHFGMPEAAPAGAAPPPTGLGQYQTILAKLVGLLSDIRDASAAPDPTPAAEEFQNAFRSANALLVDQDAFTRPLIAPYLIRPITAAWASVVKDSGQAAGGLWEVSVWDKWNTSLFNKYPFTNAPDDASLADFAEFFRPQTGLLWAFYDQHLKSSLDQQGTAFVPTRRFKANVNYTSGFLSCLKRGQQITNATFPAKGETPLIEFQINLHSVSDNISEVALEIDGTKQSYRNEPERWMNVQWPTKSPTWHGAKMRVKGYSGLDEEVVRMGDFGLIRLIESAKVRPSGSQSNGAAPLIAEWTMRSVPGSVKMDIRPSRSEHPFGRDVFRGYDCPRVIAAGK